MRLRWWIHTDGQDNTNKGENMASGTSKVPTIQIPLELRSTIEKKAVKNESRTITPEIGEVLKEYWHSSVKRRLFAAINEHYGTDITISAFYDYARKHRLHIP